MLDLNSTHQKFKYVLVTDDKALSSKVDLDQVQIISDQKNSDLNSYLVGIIDYSFLEKNKLPLSKMVDCKRLCLLINDDIKKVDASLLKSKEIHQFAKVEILSTQLFYEQEEYLKSDEQDQNYFKMATELNQEYEIIKNELIVKLNETRFDLMTSRQKILDANDRSESMRKILYSISMESSIEKIEEKLNELLPVSTKATWIKIVNTTQTQQLIDDLQAKIKTTYNYYKLTTDQIHSSNTESYSLFFIKADAKPFKKVDLNLFLKIKDLIEINLNRENTHRSLVLTEKIVRTAFENFNHPLAIIDEKNIVLQSNTAFRRFETTSNLCYKIFFDRETPCENCHKGTGFNQLLSGQHYEIESHPFKNENDSKLDKSWVHLYRNVTEQKYLEQRLQQSTQLKELGLISSSIAHELNNPIGGILSYLQLIQMDLPKTETELHSDINEMIHATLNMKKTVEDLLVFSKTSTSRSFTVCNISEVISQNIRFHDLQLKNENIKVLNLTMNDPKDWLISKLDFKDTIHFIFYFFILRIQQFRKMNSQQTGLVEIKFSQELNLPQNSQTGLEPIGDLLSIEFSCNCGNFNEVEKAKDISLLALSKLLTDQKITMQMSSIKENWITIKLVIPKS